MSNPTINHDSIFLFNDDSMWCMTYTRTDLSNPAHAWRAEDHNGFSRLMSKAEAQESVDRLMARGYRVGH